MKEGAMPLSSKDALVVVDVQVDFVSGALAVPGAEVVIAPINRLARVFEHVIVTTDWHPADHISFVSNHPGAKTGDCIATSYGEQTLHVAHCVQGTSGVELDPRLELGKAELIVRKGYRRDVESYGAFYDGAGNSTGLGAYLKARGFERVFCTGLARHVCVLNTALGAARDGFDTFIVTDASAGDYDVEVNNLRLAAAGVKWTSSERMLAPMAA
jgi:nicotinamidase/pyrazinamidase